MQIADDGQVGHLQKRRRAIDVDGDNDLAAADARDVLTRTGNAEGDEAAMLDQLKFQYSTTSRNR